MTAKVENGTTTSYAYDADGELTQDGATTFGYDATGNRTNSGDVVGPGNELTTDGTWTYSYDAEGNVTKKSKGAASDTWVYTYDNHNQMVGAAESATDGGTVIQRVTYVYDAFGNRIERDAWNGSTTTVERYGMDGWDPAKPAAVGTENFDTWVDLDGSNALTMRRAFGPGVDEVVARQDATGTVNWYQEDIQHSIRQIVDNSGTVVGTLNYDAFGQTTSSSGAIDRYQNTGREWDSILGLRYNRERIYNPATGLWMTADPMGFSAGDANLYRYVGNQSTTKWDPSGLQVNVPLQKETFIVPNPEVSVTLPKQKDHPVISGIPALAKDHVVSYTRGEKVNLTNIVIRFPSFSPGLVPCNNAFSARVRVRTEGAFGKLDPGLRWGGDEGVAMQLGIGTPGAITLKIPDLLSDNSLQNKINRYDFRLRFQASPDNGVTWASIETPAIYTLFATYKRPAPARYISVTTPTAAIAGMGAAAGMGLLNSTNTVNLQVLEASTRYASGVAPANDLAAVDAIFSGFSRRNFQIFNFQTGKLQPLTFWNTWNATAESANGLMAAGDGVCDSWADLFLQMLRSQGLIPSGDQSGEFSVTSALNAKISKKTDKEAFMIKGQWQFGKQLDKPVTYKGTSYQWWIPITDDEKNLKMNAPDLFRDKEKAWQFTTPLGWPIAAPQFVLNKGNSFIAQNNLNSKPIFFFHRLVLWDGNVYDPSYGKQFDSQQAFVTDSIAAFVREGNVSGHPAWLFREPSEQNGKDMQWIPIE